MATILESGWPGATLSAREQALCRYAERLTRAPERVGANDLNELRSAGLADEDILDLVQIIGYFNYINRVAAGLGVPAEPDWT